MKKIIKQLLSLLTVFFVLLSQINIPVRAIETEYVGVEVGLEIDDTSGAITADFDHIDRFNEYGIAIIVKDTYNDINELVKRYGLINNSGEVVLEPIYTSIIDYDANYFSVMNYGNNVYEEGIASKRDGSIVVPVKYNYIPNMDINGVFSLGYNTIVDNQSVWKSDIYSYYNGIIRLADVPEGFIKDDYENLWANRIYPDVYQVSAYREISTEQGKQYENVMWLSNSQGEILFHAPGMYIHDFYELNDAYYFVANNYGKDMAFSSGGLYKLLYTNGLPEITTLLEPTEYNGVWMDSSKNEVEVYRVSNEQWVSGRYHLETGWVGTDEFGVNQSRVFSFWGNPKFNINMECNLLEDNTNVCVHFLSLATDNTNANLFGDKKYSYIATSQFNEFIIVYDETSKKSNIFVQKEGRYFFAFEYDFDGWVWIEQNYLVRRSDLTIDMRDINDTLSLDNDRITDYGYNTMVTNIGDDILQIIDFQQSRAELIDRRTHLSLLSNVKTLFNVQLSNGHLTGYYSSLDETNQIIYKAFIYDLNNRVMTFDGFGSSISSVNDKGYVVLSHITGKSSLLYKDGTVLIPESEFNNNFEVYFERDVIIGLNDKKNVYLLSGKNISSYLDQDTVIVSDNAPILIQKESSQAYIYNNELLNTELYTKLGSFVDGRAYVQSIEGIYRVDFVNSFENKTLIDGVIDFKGAIVQTVSGFLYRDVSNNINHEVDIDNLEKVKQLSEYIYQFETLAGSKNLFAYNRLSKTLTEYESVKNLINDINHPEYYHFDYIKDNQVYNALLRKDGQLVDTVINGMFDVESNHIVRTNGNNTISILRNDGININLGTDLETFNSIEIAYGDFYNINKADGKRELVYFDGVTIKRFGDYNLDKQIVANKFVKVYKHIEGTIINPDWDADDSQTIGLYDLKGNVILNPEDGFTGYYLNGEHELLEPFYNDPINGQSIGGGIRDFSGNPIQELIGYKSTNQLIVSDEGNLNIRKATEYKQLNQMNGEYVDEYLENIFSTTSRKVVYEFDYRSKSALIHNKFYTLSYYTEVMLESEILDGQLNYYSGDILFDKLNNRVRVKYGQIYINLQNEVVFDQSPYKSVYFDGQNFIAENLVENTEKTNFNLLDEFGNVILTDYSRISKDDELGWYVATNSKQIPNPYGEEWIFELNISRIFDVKTLEVLPYYFDYIDFRNLKRDGYVHVAVYPNNSDISSLEFNSVKKYGYIRRDGSFLVEPIYDNVGEFTRTGNATVQRSVRTYACDSENSSGVLVNRTCHDFKNGLVNNSKGLILNTDYDSIESTNPTRMNWNTPNFDLDGHVRIVNYVQGDEPDMFFRNVGLANINGALFEGAVYQYAYYKNGYYYLKKFNENWKVVNGSDFEDVIEIVVPRVVEGATVNAIELIDDYVIATQRVYDETFDKIYDYVGVLNRSDMSLFMDFDYSSIKFEDGLFYLELYNTSLGTTQQAVMNEQKEFVVPFNNKYDSISEYVDGYAIGQSGTKEPESTGANPVVNLLSTFFMDVNAASDDFVLEVIDEDGKVVGDLSEQYESATLLGTVDGVTKALVKKDGKFYIATLVEKPIALIPITGVTLNTQTTSLNVGETYSLIGTILPNDANEPLRVEWSSLNSDVASVDVNGLVKALKAGTTTVSFKVNSFEAIATIIVKSTITGNTPGQDSVSTIVETIIQSNPDLEKNEQNAVVNNVENLVDYLNGEQNINDKQLLQTIQSVFDLNPNFVSQLNEDEAIAFDEILNRLFVDAFTIDVTNNDIKHQIDGLLLALNILPLLKGDDLTIRLNISETISKKDEPVLASYIQEQNYDDEFVYTLDIELIQVLNELESILSDLNRPVKLTFALPDRFVGIGELKVLRIHNGVVTELPVTLNPNYTFSFETDQFSSFTLVKASPVAVITDPESNSQTTSGGFNWMYGLVALFIIVVGAVGTLVYKRKVKA